MHAADLTPPLTDEEVEELETFLLNTEDALTLVQAEGFMTAVISAPSSIPPSTWHKVVLGDAKFETLEHANHVLQLLMRHYNEIVDHLFAGETLDFEELDEEDLTLWCAGYLEAAEMDDLWRKHEDGAAFLLPMAILSGDLDLIGEEDDKGNIITDDTPQRQRARASLPSMVIEAHQYWLAWRMKQEKTPTKPKIGRNERCPCGSGRKYKQCCLNEN